MMTMTEARLVGLVIGVALGSALWAGGVASSKNRSILLFSGLGLLFSLFGVGLALLMSPKPPKPKKVRKPRRQKFPAQAPLQPIRASSR